jgi:hypothetical protein
VFLPKLLHPFVAPIFLDFAKAIHGRWVERRFFVVGMTTPWNDNSIYGMITPVME